MIHEMLHRLGVSHEHKRPDRDSYLDVDWTNMPIEKVIMMMVLLKLSRQFKVMPFKIMMLNMYFFSTIFRHLIIGVTAGPRKICQSEFDTGS